MYIEKLECLLVEPVYMYLYYRNYPTEEEENNEGDLSSSEKDTLVILYTI